MALFVVANNVAGAPPRRHGGRRSDDHDSVSADHAGGRERHQGADREFRLGVGTLGVNLGILAGADAHNLALLYTPDPVAPGSTISHWDTIAFPNQLMEPAINADLTHSVKPPQDLTLPALRDIGWFPDGDLDGLASCALMAFASAWVISTDGIVIVGSTPAIPPGGAPATLLATTNRAMAFSKAAKAAVGAESA